MRLMLTTNGRLYKSTNNEYYTTLVYEYEFFTRYLHVFDEVRLVAHVESLPGKETEKMLRVDGPGLTVFEVPFPHGKVDYIRKYLSIKAALKNASTQCDAAIFRVPDQLAFQAFSRARKAMLPVGVEVTSNSWDLYAPGSTKSILRPFIRLLWDTQQKKVCKKADASAYVTKEAIQKRYPPARGAFSTYCSTVDTTPFIYKARDYGNNAYNRLVCLHVSGSIASLAKGHKELLQAAALLKQNGIIMRCILVGGGQLSAENAAIVHKYNLDVVTPGILNKDKISELMKRADMFVFPSYREGLPRVVVEAMASGLVCVTTNLPGIKELLSAESMVPVKDAQALARVIEQYAVNPVKMTKESQLNYSHARDYSTSKLNERRLAFYSYLYNLAKAKSNC